MKINWIALGNIWMEREIHYKLEIFGDLTFSEFLKYIASRSEKGHIYYNNNPVIMYDNIITYFIETDEMISLEENIGIKNIKAIRDGKYVDYYINEAE